MMGSKYCPPGAFNGFEEGMGPKRRVFNPRGLASAIRGTKRRGKRGRGLTRRSRPKLSQKQFEYDDVY